LPKRRVLEFRLVDSLESLPAVLDYGGKKVKGLRKVCESHILLRDMTKLLAIHV